MKSDVMGIGAPINKKDLKELLKETKETLAVDAKTDGNNRSFGVVDLWNAQKRQRTTASMMRRWSS
ncbi:hypothetical protein [Ferruginibacter sp.]|jgi:hypothetical protein|nr:hypothetical protein [Ferruginibacter sp.]